MIDALVSGTLHHAPRSRTSAAGKPFATAVVRCSTREGATVFCNVIAFAESAVTALLALSAGDSVALSGELSVKVYQPRDGGEPRPSLDLLAHAVLTAFHVQRRRKAMQARGDDDLPFDDELPPMGAGART